MTREEVIKALDICTNNDKVVACSSRNCPYNGNDDCVRDLMKDALVQIESDRDKALESKAEKVVEYKILNRDDVLNGLYKYLAYEVDWFMQGAADGDRENGYVAMHHVCGALVLLNKILGLWEQKQNEMLNSKPPEA